MDRWSNARVIKEVVGRDGHLCTVVELRGKRYGICWDGQPIRAIVWAVHQYESCWRTAIALAGFGADEVPGATGRKGGGSLAQECP